MAHSPAAPRAVRQCNIGPSITLHLTFVPRAALRVVVHTEKLNRDPCDPVVIRVRVLFAYAAACSYAADCLAIVGHEVDHDDDV